MNNKKQNQSKELQSCIWFYNEISKFENFWKNVNQTIELIKNHFKELCIKIDSKNLHNKLRVFELLKQIASLSIQLYCKRTSINIQKVIQDSIEIMKNKNSDYAWDTDFFKNFRNSELFHITSNERWFLVRMSDKISRIETLIWTKEKENKVQDEKVEDTLKDLSNYCSLLYSYIQNDKDEFNEVLSLYSKEWFIELSIFSNNWKLKYIETSNFDNSFNSVIWYRYLIRYLDKYKIWKIIYEWEWLNQLISIIRNSFKQIYKDIEVKESEKRKDDEFVSEVIKIYWEYKKWINQENESKNLLETISNFYLKKDMI